nr:transcriptional regulator [Porphyromonas sp. COT-239 OH1446]
MSELRLAIMSILMSVEEADFVYIKEVTSATSGNISVQLDKLASLGYLTIEKGFVGKRPRTSCHITQQGREAFVRHFEALRAYHPDDKP